MKKKEAIRVYNFSDADLVTLSKEKIGFMKRDIAEFLDFGINEKMLIALEDNINKFSNIPTDVELSSEQTAITANKDAKADELRVAIRKVMSRAELKFGTKSSEYKKFGTDALAQQTDADLLITSKRVVRVGTTFIDILKDNGLTMLILDNITNLTNEFENLIIDQKMKMGERDVMQKDRVEAGNAIYGELVKYTTTGFAIWNTTDAAKYNDYVLYNTSNNTTSLPILPTVTE